MLIPNQNFKFDRKNFKFDKKMNHGNISINFSSNSGEILLQNQPIGYLMCFLSLFFIILYVPCAIVLWQPTQLKNSCYKIMACMAVVDISTLVFGGFLDGIVSIVGTSESFLFSNINRVS